MANDNIIIQCPACSRMVYSIRGVIQTHYVQKSSLIPMKVAKVCTESGKKYPEYQPRKNTHE